MPKSLATHLSDLEKRLLDPGVRSSPAAVTALLTEDFREFGSSGRVYTKAQILETLAAEIPVNFHLTDFTSHVLSPDVALVTYRSHRQNPDGTTTSALRSSVWLRGEDGWRMHFHQGTKE